MYTETDTCVDITVILDRLRIHPLEVVNADISSCVTGFVRSDCIDKNLPTDFRENLAKAINEASRSIGQTIKEYPSPKFVCDEIPYPKGGKGCGAMRDRWGWKKLRTEFPFNRAGVRRTELIAENVYVAYLDLDGDGFREHAKVFWSLPEEADYDVCEVQAFFAGKGSDPKYRIKPRLSAELTPFPDIVLTYDSWNLIKPEVLTVSVADTFFSRQTKSVDLCCEFDELNRVENPDDCPFAEMVDLYRVYVDSEAECPASLHYAGGNCSCGSAMCLTTKNSACAVYVGEECLIQVIPSALNEDGICVSRGSCGCAEPDYVQVNYLTSCKPCDRDECVDFDAVCHFDALYWLTLGRMSWTNCKCPDGDRFGDLNVAREIPKRTDPLNGEITQMSHPDAKNRHFSQIVTQNNNGERRAWAFLKQHLRKKTKDYLAVYC